MNGMDIKDQNSFEKQLVKTTSKEIDEIKGEFLYGFPHHLYTIIIVTLESDRIIESQNVKNYPKRSNN